MINLPYALALSSQGGWRQHYVATFGEFADLLTFYAAWREEVSADTQQLARFVHFGRVVRHVTPEQADLINPARKDA